MDYQRPCVRHTANGDERTELTFIDFKCRIDEYHTGIVRFQCAVCYQQRLTNGWFLDLNWLVKVLFKNAHKLN